MFQVLLMNSRLGLPLHDSWAASQHSLNPHNNLDWRPYPENVDSNGNFEYNSEFPEQNPMRSHNESNLSHDSGAERLPLQEGAQRPDLQLSFGSTYSRIPDNRLDGSRLMYNPRSSGDRYFNVADGFRDHESESLQNRLHSEMSERRTEHVESSPNPNSVQRRPSWQHDSGFQSFNPASPGLFDAFEVAVARHRRESTSSLQSESISDSLFGNSINSGRCLNQTLSPLDSLSRHSGSTARRGSSSSSNSIGHRFENFALSRQLVQDV